MKSLYKNEQSGRSMVEMLGVLAIIGVLSIGGISGYSKAMAKYRVNKTLDQISMLVINIRSLFSASVDYAGLDNENAILMGIIPGDMRLGSDKVIITNAYQGRVFAGTTDNNTREFYVEYTGLTQEACVALATADWGSQAGSGLVSIAVGPGASKAPEAAAKPANEFTIANADAKKAIPIALQYAAQACTNDTDVGNVIRWTYY